MKSALTILQEAKKLIADPERWTTGSQARDATGAQVRARDAAAVSFCSIGAVYHVATDPTLSKEGKPFRALTAAAHELGAGSTVVANDTGNHYLVMRMFTLAIRKVKAGFR